MQIGRAFSLAWRALRAHPEILLPNVASILLSIIAMGVVIFATGLYAPVLEFYTLSAGFESSYQTSVYNESVDSNNYTARLSQFIAANDNQSPEYQKKYNDYLESHGWKFEHVTDTLTVHNGIIAGVIFLVYFLLCFFLSLTKYGMISAALKNSVVDWVKVSNHAIPYVGVSVLIPLILGIPIVVGILLVIGSFFLHPLIGLLMMFFIGAAIIVYVFYVTTRLLVAVPAIFRENCSAIEGLKISWKLSSGEFWQFFGASLLMGVFARIASGFVFPLFQVVIALFFDPLKAWYLLPIALFFVSVYVVAQTFLAMFLFACYETIR
ncbi:MAG: hypothetical protein Q7K43_02965 [Candidatus Woesearchaeota archaeon]|nr:hypothetical protein [Candidatus Woesearchaeota archaeon]